jgi:rhombotail lipoprotein
MKRLYVVLMMLLVSAALGGCAVPPYCAPYCGGGHHSSSSLVSFLYGDGKVPPPDNSVPELRLPLRVGLAFLPPAGSAGAGPDPALKEQLLERVRAHFSDRKFVSEIIPIPDYYLSTQHGFAGLEAVQRLYSADVLALISYDQVMHTDLNEWSLGYYTILGMYVIKGNRYDYSTLIDLAVIDPASRSLILRAGGIDTRHGNATLIAAGQQARAGSAAGFSAAADQMMVHFDSALADFEQQVRAGHANVHVVHKNGSGGGALGLPWLIALLPLVLLRARARYRALR